LPHGDTYVSALECRCVIDTVSGDSYYFAVLFDYLDDAQFIFGRDALKYCAASQNVFVY
jgi:hypothetical protein